MHEPLQRLGQVDRLPLAEDEAEAEDAETQAPETTQTPEDTDA